MFRLSLLFLASAAAALAQTASVTGRVTDHNGAVVPGVHVVAQPRDSSAKSETDSNQDGYYSLSSLQPGSYNLSPSKPGFMPVQEENLVLEVQQVARLDFSLKLGNMNQKIEVTAESPFNDSESTTMGQVVQGSQVTELPLLGRNPYALAMLVPGVRPSVGVITNSGTNQFHGTLYEFFRIDKLNANDYFANSTATARPPFKYNQFGGTVGGPVDIPHLYNQPRVGQFALKPLW